MTATRLAGDRNGLVASHGPGEVPSASEVVTLADDDPRLALARTAERLGHLRHWALDPDGRAALARMAR